MNVCLVRRGKGGWDDDDNDDWILKIASLLVVIIYLVGDKKLAANILPSRKAAQAGAEMGKSQHLGTLSGANLPAATMANKQNALLSPHKRWQSWPGHNNTG